MDSSADDGKSGNNQYEMFVPVVGQHGKNIETVDMVPVDVESLAEANMTPLAQPFVSHYNTVIEKLDDLITKSRSSLSSLWGASSSLSSLWEATTYLYKFYGVQSWPKNVELTARDVQILLSAVQREMSQFQMEHSIETPPVDSPSVVSTVQVHNRNSNLFLPVPKLLEVQDQFIAKSIKRRWGLGAEDRVVLSKAKEDDDHIEAVVECESYATIRCVDAEGKDIITYLVDGDHVDQYQVPKCFTRPESPFFFEMLLSIGAITAENMYLCFQVDKTVDEEDSSTLTIHFSPRTIHLEVFVDNDKVGSTTTSSERTLESIEATVRKQLSINDGVALQSIRYKDTSTMANYFIQSHIDDRNFRYEDEQPTLHLYFSTQVVSATKILSLGGSSGGSSIPPPSPPLPLQPYKYNFNLNDDYYNSDDDSNNTNAETLTRPLLFYKPSLTNWSMGSGAASGASTIVAQSPTATSKGITNIAPPNPSNDQSNLTDIQTSPIDVNIDLDPPPALLQVKK